MRSLFSSLDFTLSVFLVVAITTGLAFVFDAAAELVVSALAVGIFTAVAEYVMRARRQPKGSNPGSQK